MTISLDWKERLKSDTIDFYENKIPQKYYDIDVLYNIYPERIDNKVPQIVVTYVAKILASKMAKKADQYFDFYDYIIANKGDYGITIFSYIMASAIKKNPDAYINYIHKVLNKTTHQKNCNLLLDKAVMPLLTSNPNKYLYTVLDWTNSDNDILVEGLKKLIIKFAGKQPKYLKPIFKKLETAWLYASPEIIKFNISFLKSIYTLDKKFYISIYQNYKSTRNLIFAEILSNSIKVYHPEIEELAQNWASSGNVKLKKIGQLTLKHLKKMKKK